MTIDETTFAMQRPRCLVEETIQMIEEFGLDEKRVYIRAGVQMAVQDDLAQSCPLGGEHSRS